MWHWWLMSTTVVAFFDRLFAWESHQYHANNTSDFQDTVSGHKCPLPWLKHRQVGLPNGPNAEWCHSSHGLLSLELLWESYVLDTVVCCFWWWRHIKIYNQWPLCFCFLFPKPFRGFAILWWDLLTMPSSNESNLTDLLHVIMRTFRLLVC